MPWSSQTRVSCAWTCISSTNWFYIKRVLPRIFVSTCKIAMSSLSGQRNGELYMPLRPLLNDLAWRFQKPFNGSWLSPDWVEFRFEATPRQFLLRCRVPRQLAAHAPGRASAGLVVSTLSRSRRASLPSTCKAAKSSSSCQRALAWSICCRGPCSLAWCGALRGQSMALGQVRLGQVPGSRPFLDKF